MIRVAYNHPLIRQAWAMAAETLGHHPDWVRDELSHLIEDGLAGHLLTRNYIRQVPYGPLIDALVGLLDPLLVDLDLDPEHDLVWVDCITAYGDLFLSFRSYAHDQYQLVDDL